MTQLEELRTAIGHTRGDVQQVVFDNDQLSKEIEHLEDDLAALEKHAPAPKAKTGAGSYTLRASVVIPVLTDTGTRRAYTKEGDVVTTLEGDAIKALAYDNRDRTVYRVSRETLDGLMEAAHV